VTPIRAYWISISVESQIQSSWFKSLSGFHGRSGAAR
jgi:hypothetical protein